MKKMNWIVKNLLWGAIVIVAILILTILTLKIITRHNIELKVPDLSGMTVPEALKIANESSLRLEVTDSVFIPRMGRGEVYRQNPTAGSYVKKNRRVLLTINSLQPKKVAMPLVTGFSLRQAKAELAARQLKVGKLIYVQDIATNNVLSQLYQGREIPAGVQIVAESEIDLRVGMSNRNNTTSIPSLLGFSLTTAKDILIDNSLNIGRLKYDQSVKSYTDSLSSFVIKQTPTSTDTLTHPLGSRVDLLLSVDKVKLEEIKKEQIRRD